MKTLRHDFAATGWRHCRYCGTASTPGRHGAPCPRRPLNAPKPKQPKQRKTHTWRNSRLKRGTAVRVKATGEIGEVVGYTKRRKRWREQSQLRQTPIVRFGRRGQRVIDDEELERL